MSKFVHVAVGVVIDKDGKVLIAKRPQTAHQGGLWEFPGGKVAEGESVLTALTRELQEELAINVETTESLIKINHDYGDKVVLLDVHKVLSFSGVARGNEGQPIKWVDVSALKHYSFPAANRAIVNALLLPDRMLITGAANSAEEYLLRTEKAFEKAIGMVQLRCPDMPAVEYQKLSQCMQELCASHGVQLQLNTAADNFIALPSTGLHLNRHELQTLASRPVNNDVLLGASCHNEQEILHARHLGVDYITLSPVASTSSHPGATVLGWEIFQRLAAQANVPVYALGGMSESDIAQAKANGAHGIAAISCWWDLSCQV